MNREFLKELGLSDEQVEKVMKEYGKSINDIKDKANKVDVLESQIEDYKNQLEERDNQLNELSEKAKGNEELTAQIEELKQENEQTKTEYEEKLQQQAFEHKLHDVLKDSGVRNVKAVKALLDVESIKLDGDKLLGLDGQLEALKETDDYLFQSDEPEDNGPTIVNPGNPQGGGTNREDDPFKAHLERIRNE